MEPKEEKKLMEMVRENNDMLRAMRRAQKRAWWMSFFKYVFFIAIALGAYYLVQPFVENLNHAYDSVLESVQSVQNASDSIGGIFGKDKN